MVCAPEITIVWSIIQNGIFDGHDSFVSDSVILLKFLGDLTFEFGVWFRIGPVRKAEELLCKYIRQIPHFTFSLVHLFCFKLSNAVIRKSSLAMLLKVCWVLKRIRIHRATRRINVSYRCLFLLIIPLAMNLVRMFGYRLHFKILIPFLQPLHSQTI